MKKLILINFFLLVSAGSSGEVFTPGWSKTWWWILLSIAILLAGLITGVVLAK
jgi:hypothetical protein